METLRKRLANLLAVKSIVTIVLTCVFAYLTCTGGVTAEQFLTVFTVVIAFHFGTQAERRSQEAAETLTGTLVLPDVMPDSDTQRAVAAPAAEQDVQTDNQPA